MSLGIGDVFADYSIVRHLGSGGMGNVYVARHPRLPRYEALKVLHSNVATDENFRQRFIREADTAAALQHPHIVTVLDRGEAEGRMWIATEFIDGTNAAELIRGRYPAGMPADEVVPIVMAIASALDYAHEHGLLHRDVKPANILLTHPDRDGVRHVYLADFSIARPVDDLDLTKTNFVLGTVLYAAPEQLMDKFLDGRADQYALAATAFDLFTGRSLFPDSNATAVIGRHLTEPAPAPSSVRPELAPLDAAFARALAKDALDRFPRCIDFANAIATAVSESGVAYPANAPTGQAPAALKPNTQEQGNRAVPPGEASDFGESDDFEVLASRGLTTQPDDSFAIPASLKADSADFWDYVGIDPIRVVNERWLVRDFYTLRCYLGDEPIFLGRNGFVSVFRSHRALLNYLRSGAENDLTKLETYPAILRAAMNDKLKLTVSAENTYVFSGLGEDIRQGVRHIDPHQFAQAVEFLRDVSDYANTGILKGLLDGGTDLGKLVTGSREKLNYMRASLQWEQVEDSVETRLRPQ